MQTELGQVNNFGEYISLLWSFGSRVIVAFAIFFIVLGAFYYIASAGDDEEIQQGKEMIKEKLFQLLTNPIWISTALPKNQKLSMIPSHINEEKDIKINFIGSYFEDHGVGGG